MARFVDHPEHVPCPQCNKLVKRDDVEVNLKLKGGTLNITEVPQYECVCGFMFIPSETESLINDLQNDKRLEISKNSKIDYHTILNRGKKALKRK
jgi:rubredoxin